MDLSAVERPLQLDVPLVPPTPASPISNKSFGTHSYASVPRDPISPLVVACCARCQCQFEHNEEFVNTGAENWHKDCFRCAQCFEPLSKEVHFTVGRRSYCEYDFKTLYAPTCAGCRKYVMGRVIKVSMFSWHPECLVCEKCGKTLDSDGVWHYAGRILCYECNKLIKKEGGKICAKCMLYIEPGKSLRYKEDDYHGYHFNCTKCETVLDEKARIWKNELYCQKCYDQLCLICAACKRPIDNERSICALKKHWHIEHFLCARCEHPFYNSKYYERKDRAYCESCYKEVFADVCYTCGSNLVKERLTVFGKNWCPECYSCSACNRTLTKKTKVIQLDMRPICKKCYDRFPKELKHRLLGRQL